MLCSKHICGFILLIALHTPLHSQQPVPWRDPTVRNAANTYFARLDVIAEKQAHALERGVSSARVVQLRGMHYIFLSNESDVLRGMHAFLGNLKYSVEEIGARSLSPRLAVQFQHSRCCFALGD